MERDLYFCIIKWLEQRTRDKSMRITPRCTTWRLSKKLAKKMCHLNMELNFCIICTFVAFENLFNPFRVSGSSSRVPKKMSQLL